MPSKRDRAKWAARREFETVVKTLRPGDIAIDCGANVGKFTDKMAHTGATVYAFEPDPYCLEILHTKFSNTLNVNILSSAVGIEYGTVYLYRHFMFDQNEQKYSECSSICRDKKNIDLDTPVRVEQVDLIDFIYELSDTIKLIKMDIEGAEIPILERMLESTMINRVENLFVETHERMIPNISDRVSTIKRLSAMQSTVNINLDWG
jgi:FkbM family methyltransferase